MVSQQASEKNRIFYAREYRHFKLATKSSLLFLIACVIPFVTLSVLFYSPITHGVSLWSGKILAAITGQDIVLSSFSFLPNLGNVYYVAFPSQQPGFTHALICGIVMLFAIILLSQSNRNGRALMIYICMGLYVQLISCVFFIFWPEYFPYELTDYSQLYMLQQTSLWIIIPALFGIASSLVQTSFLSKFIAFFSLIVCVLLYGTLRYVVNLYLIYVLSTLYMATFFFTFGVLFDFIQMVAIYAIFIKSTSECYSTLRGKAQWQWS
ncbi:MAG: hypothetical protein RRZ24_00990 [Clostridia bacterium]